MAKVKALLGFPVILSLKSGDPIQTMNDRISLGDNGVPVHRDIHPTVHCLRRNRLGKEYMVSFDGVVIDQEAALQLLGLTTEGGVSEDDVKTVKANPKKYNYAYVRVPGKRNDAGQRPTFGSLYVVPEGEEIAHWEYEAPKTGTNG